MNKIDFSTKRINLTIVFVSLIMMLVVLNLPFKAKPLGDITFHEESKNLALFIKGKVPFDEVAITAAPGPIIFYTPAYLVAPSDATDDQFWVYGVVFTSIIITISLLLIFRIATSFFSKEIGLLSILLFFIFPIHCYYSLGILAEAPAFFSLSLALFGWSIAFQEPQKKRGWTLMLLGILFLILNRPNAMLLLAFGGIVIVYSFFRNKLFFSTYGKKLGIVLLSVGALGFCILQLTKNISGNKSATNQDTLLYYVIHEGRFQFREEPFDFRYWSTSTRPDSKDFINWKKSIQDLSVVVTTTHRSFSDVYKEFLIEDVYSHPFWFTRQFFIKCGYGHLYFINSIQPENFSMGPFKGAFGYWAFMFIINSVNLIILAGALIFVFKEKELIHYWIFWGIILSLLVFHGLTYMEPRYIFPSRVALYIMSAAGLYHIQWVKKNVNKMSALMFPVSNSVIV